MMKTKSKSGLSNLIFSILICLITVLTAGCIKQQTVTVSVYSSSLDGDRLKKLEDSQFIHKKDSVSTFISIDETTRYQQIDGFGASFNEAGMVCLNALDSVQKEDVFKKLFDPVNGAGFTLMKSPIGACDFASAGQWYSYNDVAGDTAMNNFSIARDLGQNGLVTFIKGAAKYGQFEIESPMDFAPDWMYFGIEKDKKHIRPEYYRALARYYSRYISEYARNGVKIGYLNLFNEAHNHWYSNVTYPVMGELIKNYLVPQFKADGISVKIQLGETANRPEALLKFPEVLSDPEVRKHIHSFTVHGYDWDKFSSLTELHNLYPEIPIWQTEVCYARVGGKPTNEPPERPLPTPVYNFSDGEYWGNMITNDVKNWASAWIYWNMILNQDGGPWLVSVEHGDPDDNRQHPVVIINRETKEVTYTGLYYYLAHFSKFVRPGATRIESKGDISNLNYVAFQNQDGSVVLNIINNSGELSVNVLWNGKSLHQKLKANSITTLHWNLPESEN